MSTLVFDAEGSLEVYFQYPGKNFSRSNLHWRLTVSQNGVAGLFIDVGATLNDLGFPNIVVTKYNAQQTLLFNNNRAIMDLLTFLETYFGCNSFHSVKARDALLFKTRFQDFDVLSKSEFFALALGFNKEHRRQIDAANLIALTNRKLKHHTRKQICAYLNTELKSTLEHNEANLKNVLQNYAHFLAQIRLKIRLRQPCIVKAYYLVDLMLKDENDLIVLNWQKLKHGWQAQFLPAFQLIVGSQIKLCLRSLKPSLDLKFKSSSNFKRKSKTLIRRSETDIRRALVYFKLPKLVHAVKQSQLVKWHGLGLPP